MLGSAGANRGALPGGRRRVRSLRELLHQGHPPRGRPGGLDPPHRAQAAGRGARGLDLVHPLRRRRARPAGDEGDRAGRRGLGAARRHHRGRGRGARARAGAGRGEHSGSRPRAGTCASTRARKPSAICPTAFLYGAPLPKTKFLSPYPDARFSGSVTVDGERLELEAWPGMIGHNWGSEHAERWTWIQANELSDGDGYFDAALGRIKIGPLTTPWVGNAMLRLGGEAHRLGGFDRIRSTRIDDRPTECRFELTGKGVRVRGRVGSEPRNFVAWVYADPVGPEHNTLNCSISDLELTVERDGRRAATAHLRGCSRVRDRHAGDRSRHPGAAVRRRLAPHGLRRPRRPRAASRRGESRATPARRRGGRAAPCRSGCRPRACPRRGPPPAGAPG